MKFKAEKEKLLKTLQRVQGIVEKRNTMPILSNILIEAAGGRINTTATDLEIFIKDSIEASVAEEGAITVNARKLFEIVKELPEDTIDVTGTREGKVTLKGGKARFNIMGLPAKDFPAFPKVDETILKGIETDTLKEMIDKTSFAVSTDETRYNINGFLLAEDETSLKMVTTDGHRLALIEKKNGSSLIQGDKKSVLLPRKGLNEIRRLLDENGQTDFLLGIDKKSAAVKKGDTVINVRLLEGDFPDYRKVIPDGNTLVATADRVSLLGSLKRVSILSADKVKGVKMNFTKNKLTLTTSNPDIGDATEEVDIAYDGTDMEIAFNARYIIDMLEATTAENVSISLKDQLSPGILTIAGAKDYTYIIMPMRL